MNSSEQLNTEMNISDFTDKLITALTMELDSWRKRLFSENIRAFNLGCYSWYGYLELSFLTTNEYFKNEDEAKWRIADWRWYNFTQNWDTRWDSAEELAQWMSEQYDYYEDPTEAAEKAEEFLHACAKAVISKEVRAELEKYNLTDDSEISVFNGDHPSPPKNYCDNQ